MNILTMRKKLQRVAFSVPVVAVASLFTLYLLAGFFAIPALVKWQAEKQAAEILGHKLNVTEVRFNPLTFRFEAGEVALAGPAGGPLLGFKRLLIEFEPRGVFSRTWTFAQVTLEAPVVHLDIAKGGTHNFTAILDLLRDDHAGTPPRFLVNRLELKDGRIEYSDRLLAEPVVARIETLLLEVDNLSNLPEQATGYRLSARTVAGETIETSGNLALNPLAVKGKLSLNDVMVATLARGFSRLFAVESPAGLIELAATFDFAVDERGAISGGVQALDIGVAGLALSSTNAVKPLLAIDTLALKGGRIDLSRREVTFAAFRANKGSVAAAVDARGDVDWAGLVRASAASTPPTTASAKSPAVPAPWRVAVTSADISEIALSFADASGGRSVKVDTLALTTSATAQVGPAGPRLEFDQARLSIAGVRIDNGLRSPGAAAESVQLRDASVEGGKFTLQSGQGGFDLGVAKLRGTLAGLQLQHGVNGVEIGSASIANENLLLAQADGQLRLTGGAAKVSVSRLAARQGPDRIALQDASLAVRTLAIAGGGVAASQSRVEARLEDAALQLTSAGVVAQGASAEIAQVAAATVAAKSLLLALPDGPPELTADGLAASLSDTVLRSPADASELLSLGTATLAGGALRLKDRLLTAEKLELANGKAQTRFDAKGNFNWTSLRGAAPATVKAAVGSAPAASATPWRVAFKSAALDGIAVGFEDRRESPALGVGLEAIRARIAGLDSASATPMQLEVQTKIASGGELEASGRVRADNGVSDLKLKLAGVALAPLQAYLSKFAELRLATGTASAEGRLRYGDAAVAGARLVYEGGVALDQVLVEEIEPKRPFLGWNAATSGDVVLTLEPNRLDIGELRLERPTGRVIIAQDQTVNVMDVFKQPAARKGGAATPRSTGENAQPASTDGREIAEVTFPVNVARVRLSGGTLEFADLSLRPQFGARMHELNGLVTGLSTDPARVAKVQLDARVDKYGSAKIRGQISVLRPEKFTEIELAFRNLEMTALSPYIVKFAGYQIAGGRLALDLQYRVRDGKLLGENKIVLNQVELGKKVDSPGALDLPLELAIAILTDSDGVIDIGLPVSGDLNDPKFDYGAVIGKAFGNLLIGIVTAPFRALAALFGAGEKKLGTIDFEPGSDAIAPPERQKLEAVARALKARPALKVLVPLTYAEEDRPVMKSLAVRSDIVTHMGIALSPGEDPGPIDTASPRVQRAVEAAFGQRYAVDVLPVLKRRAIEASSPAGDAAAPAGEPAVQSPPLEGGAAASAAPPVKPPPGPPPAFYQNLVDRMISEEPVSEQMLMQLAARRGEAIVRELTTVGGVPAARAVLGEPRKETDPNDKAVTLQLELEVAK